MKTIIFITMCNLVVVMGEIRDFEKKKVNGKVPFLS